MGFASCFLGILFFVQKLTALKKAYAEIILNTAKEAAARIMVSERKALRYHQEVFAAKDEALHMLLRLKQMLDAKVTVWFLGLSLFLLFLFVSDDVSVPMLSFLFR